MLQLVHNHISWSACLSQRGSNCFTDAKPRTSAKRTCSKCPACTKDGSRISIFVKCFQTPKLPNIKKLVNNLWITRQESGRPAPGAQRQRSKLRNSSHKLPNSRNKTNPNWPGSQQPGDYAPGAPATSRESFGIKTAENSQIFLHLSLDRS